MEALTGLGASLLVAKILTELILIPISFAVQRRWVFLPTQRQENTREKTQAIAASSGLRAVSYESARVEAAGIRTGVRASRYASSSSTLAPTGSGRTPRFLPPVSREGGWEKHAVAPKAAASVHEKPPLRKNSTGAFCMWHPSEAYWLTGFQRVTRRLLTGNQAVSSNQERRVVVNSRVSYVTNTSRTGRVLGVHASARALPAGSGPSCPAP